VGGGLSGKSVVTMVVEVLIAVEDGVELVDA
jgi:hypothetical protein